MKQSALILLFALTAWGQSPPEVTVTDTLHWGVNGQRPNGSMTITIPPRDWSGNPLVSPPITIPITNGFFTVNLVPNDITTPATVYTVTILVEGTRVTQTWWVYTSATPLNLAAVVQQSRVAPPSVIPRLPLPQIAITGALTTDCIGNNGSVAVWRPCGGGGGGGGISSVFGRTGPAITAQTGDYTTAQVPEAGGVLYFTPSRAVSAMSGLYVSPASIGAPSGVAGLNSSGLVPPAQLGTGTPSSTTCLYGDGTFKPCSNPLTAGEGINIIGTTIQTDPAIIPRWGSGSVDPTYSATAGRDTYLNAASDDWFLRGASAWKKIYTAGRMIGASDIPFPGSTTKGGILSTLCTSIQATRGYGSDGLPVCVNLATGSGTVTSVALSLPGDFTVTGSPVTAAGSLAATWASQTGNKFLASPSGSTGAPSFRSIVQLDLGTGSGGAGTKVLYDDLTWKTPAGGGGTGNMTNTGASAVSQIPRYTSILGTDLAPSTVTVDTSGNLVAPGTITAGGTGSGCLTLPGSTSGSAKICAAAVAGTPADLIPPTATGSPNYILQTDGGTPQQLSWVAKPAAESTTVTNTGTGADVLKTTTNVTARRIKAGTNVTVTQNTDDITIDASGGGGSTGLYSGTIDFGSIPDGGCVDGTFTATGLTTGKTLAVGLPSAWNTGLVATAIASAADTAKIRACNFSGAAVDPASATFKVRDMDSLGYLTGTATIDFGSIPDGACSASTITLSGAAVGDLVAEGWPSGLAAGLSGKMFVSATDTVAVRLCNWSGAAVDPASGSFKAAITR